jgi:hypothetical protein
MFSWIDLCALTLGTSVNSQLSHGDALEGTMSHGTSADARDRPAG